eukprot:6684740-Pyramimonas_sp.AAC.1
MIVTTRLGIGFEWAGGDAFFFIGGSKDGSEERAGLGWGTGRDNSRRRRIGRSSGCTCQGQNAPH